MQVNNNQNQVPDPATLTGSFIDFLERSVDEDEMDQLGNIDVDGWAGLVALPSSQEVTAQLQVQTGLMASMGQSGQMASTTHTVQLAPTTQMAATVLPVQTASVGQIIAQAASAQTTPTLQVVPLAPLASSVLLGSTMLSDPTSSTTHKPSSNQFSGQDASAMLAQPLLSDQSAASAQSDEANIQDAEEIIEGYKRKKAAGKTDPRKKKDVVSENARLIHQILLLKAAKASISLKMLALQSKSKRQVCFLSELSYRYKTMDAYMLIMNTIYP